MSCLGSLGYSVNVNTITMDSAKIKEFYNELYPLKVWVAKNLSYKEAKEVFYSYDKDEGSAHEMAEEEYGDSPSTIATCAPVGHKESGIAGILCHIERPKEMTVGLVAHEATHICDFFCDQLGISGFGFNDGEARAYLTQWAADCIDKVRTGRIKDK